MHQCIAQNLYQLSKSLLHLLYYPMKADNAAMQFIWILLKAEIVAPAVAKRLPIF
jgi:hypothetical protein